MDRFPCNPFQNNIHTFTDPLPLLSYSLHRGIRNTFSTLTLSILSILVASHWVHAVTGSAVGGRTVRLRSWEAVHGLDGVTPLAAAGRDGVGSVQATVKGRDGEVSLGLWRNPTGVAQDAHHLEKHRRQHTIIQRRKGTCAYLHADQGEAIYVYWCLISAIRCINIGLTRMENEGLLSPKTDPTFGSPVLNALYERHS